MTFAPLYCKGHAGRGERACAHTLARPQLFPSVPRVQTPKLLRASHGLDMLLYISIPTSIQTLTSFCLVGGFFCLFAGCVVFLECFWGLCFVVLIPTSHRATTQLDKERRLSVGFYASLQCALQTRSVEASTPFCFLKNVP